MNGYQVEESPVVLHFDVGNPKASYAFPLKIQLLPYFSPIGISR
jgi:hypothetical protein